MEMEDYARVLRSSCSESDHVSESFLLSKFLNCLPTEYEVQKQMLEDREGELSRDVVMATVRKRFESEVFQKLLSKGGE